MGANTTSLYKAIQYAREYDYGEVVNSIGETFTLDEFYKEILSFFILYILGLLLK